MSACDKRHSVCARVKERESNAKWSQLSTWFEFYISWKAEVTPQTRHFTLARLNLPIPSVMTDNAGKQSAVLRPCPQTNHLNPDRGLLRPDTKGSGNMLLEANYINTLLSLNCLSLWAQPFSTLVQPCRFTACVWGHEEKRCRCTHAYTHKHTHTRLQARIPWNDYCLLYKTDEPFKTKRSKMA